METKQLFLSDVTDEEFNAIYDVVKSINKEHIDYLEIGCNAGGTLVRLLNKSNKENINVHLTGIDLFEDIVYETQNLVYRAVLFSVIPCVYLFWKC